MDESLYRIEETLCSLNSGNLKSDSWDFDHVLAHGLSGQRNRIGNAIDHLIAHPNTENYRMVVFFVSGILAQEKVCQKKDAPEVAKLAIEWYWDKHCPKCGGRGVLDFEQHQCPECYGTGEKPKPSAKPVREAVSIIIQSVNWMEGQLRARLRMSTEVCLTQNKNYEINHQAIAEKISGKDTS